MSQCVEVSGVVALEFEAGTMPSPERLENAFNVLEGVLEYPVSR
jgi:hypothetical protein